MGNTFAEIKKIQKLREDIKNLSEDAKNELLHWLFLDGIVDYIQTSNQNIKMYGKHIC